jgi:hypothetical protein
MHGGITAAMLFVLAAAVLPASADIYRYESPDGVVHFTDAPTDRRFKVFMRDLKKDQRLRTTFRVSGNPAEYDSLIGQYAQQYGVDVSLVKAVIHAESGYNPNAVSRVGAQGLMQLMPKTAKGLNVANSFDPQENIKGGVRYLRFLLDTFHGDERLALAAYNAGLNKVAKYGGVPPYTETKNYVTKVLDYRTTYQNGRVADAR